MSLDLPAQVAAREEELLELLQGAWWEQLRVLALPGAALIGNSGVGQRWIVIYICHEKRLSLTALKR